MIAARRTATATDVGAFNSRALLHNLKETDYDKPLDEIRDLFWSSPRMPLLPAGEADLQRAIYEAVTEGALRLVAADGTPRVVTNPAEIGVGQSGLRLAKPVVESPVAPDGISANAGGVSSGDGDSRATGDDGGVGGGTGVTPTVREKQLTLSVRASLSLDDARNALYSLVQELADKLDEGAVSYAEMMIKVRIAESAATSIAEVAQSTSAMVDLRDV